MNHARSFGVTGTALKGLKIQPVVKETMKKNVAKIEKLLNEDDEDQLCLSKSPCVDSHRA